jgi:hypothetical protein
VLDRRPRVRGVLRATRILALAIIFIFSLLVAFAPDSLRPLFADPAPVVLPQPNRLPNSIGPFDLADA